MIVYEPFYNTLKKCKITEYKLVNEYGFSPNTFYRMKCGENISTRTINSLCKVLNCGVEGIVKFIED